MQYTDQQNQELPKIYEKIKDVRIAMLTTMNKSKGTLHSRPMSTHKTDPDGTLWFFTYDDSEKADEVALYDNVNLSYADMGSDLYVSISGSAEIVQDKARMEKLWNPILKAWFPDGLETPNIALLKVNIAQAEYWDANSNKMIQLFQMAKAAVLGKVADLGEHEKIDLRQK